ncbi:hypothetical protein [Paludifilum halophilum]|uniref:Uncharacterized protein n=1 Tax=Paludifilum halophilum TaxID=1642702 RepID=A0A235B951_9BACL|nr:hypothetical protein [Paludifilum halophilum]OYD08519.1 hypothetical protein CHM34_06750 [Paludifilum halophilum]
MVWFFVVGGFLVFAGSLSMSFRHSLEFYYDIGQRGVWAIIPTATMELALVIFVVGLMYYRRKAGTAPAPVVIGTIVCGLFIGYTNFRAGLAYGLEGVAGFVIFPLVVVLLENSTAGIAKKEHTSSSSLRENVQKSSSSSGVNEEELEAVPKFSSSVQKSAGGSSSSESSSPSSSSSSSRSSEKLDAVQESDVHLQFSGALSKPSSASSFTASPGAGSSNDVQPVQEKLEAVQSEIPSPASSGAEDSSQDPRVQEPAEGSGQSPSRTDKGSSETITSSLQPARKSISSDSSVQKSETSSSSRKTGGSSLKVLEGGKLDPELEELVQVALEIIQKEGKCGRPRLRRETGCAEGPAKRALNIIKKQQAV